MGRCVYLHVSNDYAGGTSCNSSIIWAWTDDIMNGTWHFGENGIEEVYSDPGMVIGCDHGNGHGGTAKVSGAWYCFGHRHTGATVIPARPSRAA